MEGKLNGVLLMMVIDVQVKLTARSYSLARDTEDAEKFFYFLLFAETPKSKSQLCPSGGNGEHQ